MVKTIHNKAVSLVMAFVFSLSFLAPAFLAPLAANASSTYSALSIQNVKNISTPYTGGIIEVDVPNTAALHVGDILSIQLPSKLDFASINTAKVPVQTATVAAVAVKDGHTAPATATYYNGTANATYNVANLADASTLIDVPAKLANGTDNNNFVGTDFTAIPIDRNTIDLQYTGAESGAGMFYIRYQHLNFNGTIDGAINVTMAAPTSTGWTSGTVGIGNFNNGSGATTVIEKSVKTLSDTTVSPVDTIMFQETAAGSLAVGVNKLKFKVPDGYQWDDSTTVVAPDWGFQDTNAALPGYILPASLVPILSSDKRTLEVDVNVGTLSVAEGRFYIAGAKLQVTDTSVAKFGNVVMHVSGDNVTDQDVTVANYQTYASTVVALTSPTVTAGWNDTTIGDFEIDEGVANSLVPGRSITMTLPTGVKWYNDATAAGWPYSSTGGSAISTNFTKGGFTLAIPAGTTDSGRTLTYSVGAAGSTHSTSNVQFKKLDVTIDPSFTGDINLTIGGTAGATGTVKVGTVVSGITLTNDGKAQIQAGAQGQAISDITITENAKAAIESSNANKDFVIALPSGATFAAIPTAKVTTGDASIDKVNLMNSDNELKVTMKGESSTPATITISGIKVTTNRSIPEGDFKATVKALNDSGALISGALTDNAILADFNESDITSAVVGQVITPASGVGTSGSVTGQFRINSNIYVVDGVSKVMDAAPYIKNGRTYVPLRYVGLALGVADSDIVWDATAQTATLTLGSAVEVFTIGSTTYTVNGEAKTMDVAPEINNGRTMLPARYVAEGFGYAVGWDASTGTVLVSK